MHYTRLLIIVIATILALGLGVFALVRHNAPQGGDPIIIKGGSLTIECPKTDAEGPQCISFDAATGKYGHKTKTRKITQIVVKDTTGAVLFDSSDPQHCGVSALGKTPEIDVFYKP